MAAGLPISRSLLTIGVGLLALAALLHPKPYSLIRQTMQHPHGRWLWLAYGLYLISVIYTENVAQWQYLVWTKLPMLLLPMALLHHKATPRQVFVIQALYVLGVCCISLLTLVNYILYYPSYHELLLQSKAIPIAGGMLHLSFGLMQAGAVVLCLAMALQPHRWRIVAAALFVFLFVCVHVFSSRTGLLCTYAGVLAVLWQQASVWSARLRRVVLAACVLLPAAAMLLPSLRHKLHNSWQDIRNYQAGRHLDDWSLGRRLAAWQVAWQVGVANPFVGVAPADVRSAMEVEYEKAGFNMSPSARAASHNQYLEIFAGLGVLGLGLHAWWAWCCYRAQRGHNVVLVAHGAILLAAMLTDNLLDYQLGLCWAVFFTCILWLPDTPSPA